MSSPARVPVPVRMPSSREIKHLGRAHLADPEGNEFCILRREAELSATGPGH